MWWFMIVARGRVHVEFMPETWEQTGQGMAEMVWRLPRILRGMLGPRTPLPRVVVTDRGPGFYLGGIRNGQIVPVYQRALEDAGFRPFAASDQPADCPDVLLHETAVGWVRKFFKKHPFSRARSLDGNIVRVQTLMAECVRHINRTYEVGDLCASFPKRLHELLDGGGERLRH